MLCSLLNPKNDSVTCEYEVDGLTDEDLRNIVLTDLVRSHVALPPPLQTSCLR